MVDYTERLLDQWREGEVRDAHQEMMGVTMRIVAKTLFDAEVGQAVAEVGAAFDTVIQEIATRFRRPFRIPGWVPTPGNLRYRQGVRKLNQLIFAIIEERRGSGRDAGDLLSMLLAVEDEDGSRMTERQIRDEAVTLFLAGHETTALSLSWTFYLLAQRPEAEAELVKELGETLDGRAPTVADLPKLPFTEMVVMESMRLYPPAYVVGREALADCEMGGYRVPRGTTLS